MTRLITLIVVIGALSAGTASAAQIHSDEVGGQRTNLAQLVEIDYHQGALDYSCSGAVISPDVILTAAHCAGGHGYWVSNRLYGGWSARPPVTAPGYNAAAGYVNDLAVLRLDHNVTVAPLAIADTEPAAGTPAISYGWGDTNLNGGGAGTSPRQLTTAVESNADCTEYWSTTFVTSDLCASSSGTIADGDSGGPLVADGQIVGVNDKAADQLGSPSIFTRTDVLAPWIRAQIAKLALAPYVKAQIGMARPTHHKTSGVASGRG